MKTRTGFISNSSSSSFVVAFPEKPTSIEQLKDLMFTRNQSEIEVYDYSANTDTICAKVLADIQNQSEITFDQLVNLFSDQYYADGQIGMYWQFRPGRHSYKTEEEYFKVLDEYDNRASKLAEEYGKEEAEEFLKKHKDKFILVVKYSDNGEGELGIVMEHGNIFRNLDHIRISHH